MTKNELINKVMELETQLNVMAKAMDEVIKRNNLNPITENELGIIHKREEQITKDKYSPLL